MPDDPVFEASLAEERVKDFLVSEQLYVKRGPWFDVRAWGARGDGVTDDTNAIQAAIDAVPSSGGTVLLPAGIYVVNGTLTCHDKEGITIQGAGLEDSIYSAAPTKGTVLKRVSGVATLLSVGTISGSLTESMEGVSLTGFAIDGNNLAATGLKITSVRGGNFKDLYVRECTTVALDVTTVSMSGAEDTQRCSFERVSIRQSDAASGIGARFSSASAGIGNTSMNELRNFLIFHTNGVGVQFLDFDSNTVLGMIVNRAGGGSGIGVELGASNHASSGHARSNAIYNLQPGAGGVTSRGAATGSQTAKNNVIFGYNLENSSALPTIETGSTLAYFTSDGLTDRVGKRFASCAVIEDDFSSGANVLGQIGELSWNQTLTSTGAGSCQDAAADHLGIYRINTGATSGATSQIGLRSTGQGVLLPAEDFDLTFLVRLNQNDVNTTARVGLARSYASNPDSLGIYFERLDADGSWFGVCRAATVQTRSSAVGANTTDWVKLRVRRLSSTTIGFSLANAPAFVFGTEQTVASNVPINGLQPFLQIVNSAAADKSLDVDYMQLLIPSLSR